MCTLYIPDLDHLLPRVDAMRFLLLSALFLFPALAAAQEATWVSTDGPGYADLGAIVLDHEGQPLLGTNSGTLVFSDGTWASYTNVRNVLAVVDDAHFIAGENYIFGGSGQDPFNEYVGSAVVWHRAPGGAEMMGHFTYSGGSLGGFAERALVSPDGDVWVGFQNYYGFNGDLGEDDGVGVARLASEDITANPDNWTTAELPEAAESLHALGWAPALGLLVATDDGVYALVDDMWTRLGLAGEPISAVVATDDGTLLAAGANTVYRSTDDGMTWTPAATLPGGVNDLLVTDDAILAAVAGAGVYRSTDTGSSWTPTDLTASAHDLAGLSSGPYYAAAEGATLYASEDGLAWAAKRFVTSRVQSLTSTADGLLALTGTLYRFAEGAWQEVSSPGGSRLAVSPTTGAYHLASVYDQQDEEPGDYLTKVYRSTDAGASWTQIHDLVGAPTGLAVTTEGTVLLGAFANTTGSRVERLPEGATTWSTPYTVGSPYVRVQQAASETVYAIGEFGYEVSTDDGQTWDDGGSPPFPADFFEAIAESQDGALVISSCDGVLRSDDGGATWTASDLTLPTGPLAQNSAGDLFAGVRRCAINAPYVGGVYRSTDGGLTWAPYGLGDTAVYDFYVDADGVLFAGTDRGVVRTDMTTVDTETPVAPSAFSVEPAFPNPFAGSTTVAVTLAETGPVTVAVYDAVGRAVATLHDGPLAAGRHALTWTGARHASGVYFVRITGPAGTRTVPVTLAR